MILFLFALSSLCANITESLHDFYFDPPLSSLDISDWNHPSQDDYEKIEAFLVEKKNRFIATPLSERPYPTVELNRDFYGWITYLMKGNSLIAKAPERHVDYLGNPPDQRKWCVITYATRSIKRDYRDYVRGVKWIKKALAANGFKGHFIYYIGGWPGLKQGRLRFADVPYAFKPFLFEEARDLGYKSILWLDASILPVRSLNLYFRILDLKGLSLLCDGYTQSWRETFDIGHTYLMPEVVSTPRDFEVISSSLIGLNMDHPQARALLDEWIQAAERRTPFLIGDMPVFQFLVSNLGLNSYRIRAPYYKFSGWGKGDFTSWKKEKKIIFFHQYDLVDPNFNVPENLF